MDDRADAWQQLAEQESYLWSSLQAIKQYISEETYQKAERELGFAANERTTILEGENEQDCTSFH